LIYRGNLTAKEQTINCMTIAKRGKIRPHD
jgi:hypothetical protein